MRSYILAGKALLYFSLLVIHAICQGQTRPVLDSTASDPLFWKPDIEAFTLANDTSDYPLNAVLFAGSSSIRLWDSLAQDMAPVPVIQRGFGGAKIEDVLYWAPELILCHDVKSIVLFAGTNNFSGNADDSTPEIVLHRALRLFDLIHRKDSSITIFYISITPTPQRWDVWPSAKEANHLISQYASQHDYINFLDFSGEFLLPDGTPNSSLFLEDMLHLNRKGYKIWTDGIKPLLIPW